MPALLITAIVAAQTVLGVIVGFVVAAEPAGLGEALITYGPLGIGVFALGIFAAKAYDWQVKRGDKAEARADAMVDEVMTKVLPALARNTEVLALRTDLDREIVEALKDAADAMRDLRPPPTRTRAKREG